MAIQRRQWIAEGFLMIAAAFALAACNDDNERVPPGDTAGPSDPEPPPPSPPGNDPPTADAGPDRTVDTGSLVILNGEASDPDGDSLTYEWSLVTEPGGASTQIADARSRQMRFTPGVAGSYIFELTVNDGTLDSAVDAVTITSRDEDNGEPGATLAPSKRHYAPITVWIIDNFQNGNVSNADLKNAFWHEAPDGGASPVESGGTLVFRSSGASGGGRLQTEASHTFNFFLQPLRFSLKGISFTGDSAARKDTVFQFALASTELSGREAPDAIELSVFGDNHLTLAYKTDAPGSDVRANTILLDQKLASAPGDLHITLDQTSYMVVVSSPKGEQRFRGQHNIRIADWGYFGHSAASLQTAARTGAADRSAVSVALDAVEIASLKMFDAFTNDLIDSTGSRKEFWASIGGNPDRIAESGGNLTLKGQGSAALSSPTTKDFNFFAQRLAFSGGLDLNGASNDADVKIARFGLTAGRDSTRDSPSALALAIDTRNGIRFGWKTQKRGALAEETHVLAQETLKFRPTSFELAMTRTTWSLIVSGDGGNRAFSGTHSMKWYEWSPTGNASLTLEAESSSEKGQDAIARWSHLTVLRDQEYYVAPTVLGPFSDGVELEVPDLDPAAQPLARWGFVDVTRPPFSADATGQKDSTSALQHAMDFARENYLVALLPAGEYLVSDTLSCTQSLIRRSSMKLLNDSEGPCQMQGSRLGDARPRLVLAAGSPGFSNPAKPKPVVNFWARSYYGNPEEHQPNISYNQMFVNIDIEIRPGNSGAIGISHRGAQGSGVQESTIDATHGFAGLDGGSGSGGSHADITVIGGQYGLYLRGSQPAATITGITLSGQSKSGILYGGRQTLSAVGVSITVPDDATGPAISVQGHSAQLGQVSLVDSVIRFERSSDRNLVIRTDSSVYLKNVYVKNAGTIVETIDGGHVDGNVYGWALIDEYAKGIDPPPYRTSVGTFQYEAPLYLDGVRRSEPLVDRGSDGAAPPADIQSRHLWSRNGPGWESPNAANVRLAPYFAEGDGTVDDTAAIQRAIDENQIVFLPKGYFRISRPLVLHSDTRLIGAGSTLTNLIPDPRAAAFSNASNPQPLVTTDNDPRASTELAFLQLRAQVDAPGVYALNWRAGRDSIFRAVNINRLSEYGHAWVPGKDKSPARTDFPLVRITGNGGGKWYNFNQGQADYMAPGYRHILIEGTSQELSFYQFNPEHAQGEANAEVRNAANVNFYGVKCESNYPVLWIRDSDNINLYGYGGNAAALAAGDTYPQGFQQFVPSLFRVERTTNLRLVSLVDEPRVNGGHPVFGLGVNPGNWYMLLEADRSNNQIATVVLDRPVLYKRVGP